MTQQSWSARRGRSAARALATALAAALAAVTAGRGWAQEPARLPAAAATGGIAGRAVAEESGAPLAGVRVRLQGGGSSTVTDDLGRFRLARVPAGRVVVLFEFLGRKAERRTVEVHGGDDVALNVPLVPSALAMAGLVVSATREAQPLARTPATVGVVSGETLREERPVHPSEVLGRVPGVWVSTTGGEGHMTAIRQPLTTDPVYLYLEDGVPTRSTGFFNHNALYEINVPQAERIEVVKGPVTALYGSDAIGGVIDVQTRSALSSPGFDGSLEGGANGFARLLGSYGYAAGGSGVRADLNLTRTDGWRDATAYDRQSGTVRWDRSLGSGRSLKAVASYSHIDQQTAGSSRLPEAAYRETPALNLTPISFRRVAAARISLAYEQAAGAQLLSITPYARSDAMDMLPNWSLTYDPALVQTANRSLGLLARYRRDLAPLDARVIAGLDVDWSPGRHAEQQVAPTRVNGAFTDYTVGADLYDYRVTFTGVSPYLHAEASPAARLRLTAGLRFDWIGYDYQNRLGELQAGAHRRPGSTSASFRQLSPKLGATLDLGHGASAFASWSRGFRAPAEAQLFRQGAAANTVGLRPVTAESREAGVRGQAFGRFRYELSAYSMTKRNDILAFQRTDDVRETRNAGATRHRGIELGAGGELGLGVTLETSLSWAEHTYLSWRPDSATDYRGHELESAPHVIGNSSLTWQPRGAAGPRAALEWSHLGAYWLNAQNTARYPGHDLLGLQASWPVAGRVTLFARVHNLADVRYAEDAGWSALRGRELAPGMPRTLYAGAELAWGGR